MNKVSLKISYRLLYPVIPVIITSSYRGTVAAMPAVSYMMVSNNPAIIGVCLEPGHTTYKVIKKSKKIAFSWIDKKEYDIINSLVTVHGYEAKDKLHKANIKYFLSDKLKLPVPENSVAYIEGKVIRQSTIGDHILILSKVLSAYAIEDFDGYWKFNQYTPIFYTGMQNGLKLYH